MPASSTYTPIATQTLSSDTGIVTFSSIPQTYTDLIFVVSGKASSATFDISAIRVNSITSGYSRTYYESNGSTPTTGRGTSEISIRAGYLPGTNYTSQFSSDIYHFMNYSNTSLNKEVLCICGAFNTSTNFNTLRQVSYIPTSAAITQITIQTANGANLRTGSTFTLYGVTAA